MYQYKERFKIFIRIVPPVYIEFVLLWRDQNRYTKVTKLRNYLSGVDQRFFIRIEFQFYNG